MKKFFVFLTIAFLTMSFVSCGQKQIQEKDYKVWIMCGNGDSVLLDMWYMATDIGDKEIIRKVAQNEFNSLRSCCNYPRTFVPTDLMIWHVTDTIEYHYVSKDDGLDDTVTLFITKSYPHGVAKNAYGVEGDVDELIVSCYLPDDDWAHCWISENGLYAGSKHKLYKNKKELNKTWEGHDFITLKNGEQYHFDTWPIKNFLKYRSDKNHSHRSWFEENDLH